MTADTITAIKKALEGVTPGPWFMSGVRFRMNGSVWHSVNRYDESLKRDEGIACVGYDERTGAGLSDAKYIAAVNPVAISGLLSTLEILQRENEELRERQVSWRPMDSAPKDGKHCILSIPTGSGFIYSAQGVFRDGKWDNALNIDAQPLAWMPNVLLPDELCPWLKPDSTALSSTGDTHGN